MLRDDVGGDSSALRCESRVGVWVPCQRGERFPQSPAATTHPGGAVDWETLSERLAAIAVEERPREHGVAGRIPDCRGAEVDHAAESPMPDQQVVLGHVAVHPNG